MQRAIINGEIFCLYSLIDYNQWFVYSTVLRSNWQRIRLICTASMCRKNLNNIFIVIHNLVCEMYIINIII